MSKENSNIKIENIFKVFLITWQGEGFHKKYFLEKVQRNQIFNSMSQEDKDELKEVLIDISQDKNLLNNLYEVIKRKRVLTSDDFNLKLVYANISALTNQNFEVEENNTKQNDISENKEEYEEYITNNSNQISNDLDMNEVFNNENSENKTNDLFISDLNEKDFNLETSRNKTNDLFLSDLNLSLKTFNGLRRNLNKNKKIRLSDCNGLNKDDFLTFKRFGLMAFEDFENALLKIGLKLPLNITKDETLEKEEENNFLSSSTNKLRMDEQWLEVKNIFTIQSLNFLNIEEKLNEFINYNFSRKETFDKALFINFQQKFNALIEKIKYSLLKENSSDNRVQYLYLCIFRSLLLKTNFAEAENWMESFNRYANLTQSFDLPLLVRRLEDLSLGDIGRNYGVTGESIRRKETKLLKNIGLSSKEFKDGYLKMLELEKDKRTKELLIKSINQYNRLLILNDNESDLLVMSEDFRKILKLSLQERLEVYEKFNYLPTKEEYDFHFKAILNKWINPGKDYWDDINNLKNFFQRFASFLDPEKPKLMPKQTQLPSHLRSVIKKHGTHGAVAEKVGLIYQGNLFSDSGDRKFWNDEKLTQVLEDVNIFNKQDSEIMPSQSQVNEFFKQTEEDKYKDKNGNNLKPGSVIAALGEYGKLSWAEVSGKFKKKCLSGKSQKVTKGYIKKFVKDLGDHLSAFDASELYTLFQAQGINRSDKNKYSRTFDTLIDAVQTGLIDKQEVKDWANDIDVPAVQDLLDLGSEFKQATKQEREISLLEQSSKRIKEEIDKKSEKIYDIEQIQAKDLPSLDPGITLKALDSATAALENIGTDIERIEFLKAKATAKIWKSCFKNQENFIEKFKLNSSVNNIYSEEVRKAFVEEYNGAKNLEIPSSYQFKDLKGIKREPKLMQKLFAFRLKRDKRILNLSGTGTGKTLSAILAAQVCGSKRILISCPNGVIDSWIRTFESAYPEAIIHIKPKNWEVYFKQDEVNVVIVNHEKFQDRASENLLNFCHKYHTDLIVIDEIHQAKKRTSESSSQRRKLMDELIKFSSNLNIDLRVIGLSATPVINNLYEGKSLIELITQKNLGDIKENNDLNSCMNLYQNFILNGIRMNPSNLSRTQIIHKNVDASSLLSEIISAAKSGKYHLVERLLVKPKLNILDECLTRGTKSVIFINLIQGTLNPITSWLKERGFNFSIYTGGNKEANDLGFKDSLDEFIKGNTEVLVASIQCAGTGVDGLQSVCNKAIFFQLPWTSTEFEQSIGRLDRDGTVFKGIKIYLPLTYINLPSGDTWSWCHSKLERINSKKDIAKAAVDGEIPDSQSILNPKEASRLWLDWLEKLNLENTKD